MDSKIPANDDAAPSMIFGAGSGGEFGDGTFATTGVFLSPICNHHGKARASVVDRVRADRATIVNRILDWSDEARAKGQLRRAEHMVCLAWAAYDQRRA
jgi:hypothetical protein